MNSIAFIGNYAPRRCGIATFTHDLRTSVLSASPTLRTEVVMVSDNPDGYSYPEEVRVVLSEQDRADYRRAAQEINRLGVDCVSLQHEFGIYGGPSGAWILDLLQALHVPVVTTCHTLLKNPSPEQRHVLQQIAHCSAKMVVMAEKGREFLRDSFGVPDRKIVVIPHGIPDAAPSGSERLRLRERMGWTHKSVFLTFGLLSPNKGLEHAIRSLPAIVRRHPNAHYVIVGATHPNLVREQGESYREGLQRLAEELGVSNHLEFVNTFVSRDELVRLIDAADVYVTPYLNEAQITSGTLSFAYGLGKPVISTPYWHAAELLANDAGMLIPFGDVDALATAADRLLSDEGLRERLAAQGRERGRGMTWPNIGRLYLDALGEARQEEAPAETPRLEPVRRRSSRPALNHLVAMSGKFGIFQHAKFTDPDPAHGFCIDDNARALIFLTSLSGAGHTRPTELDVLAGRCLASLFQAFNPKTWRFRNFMDVNGEWLEEVGSEDSHGRALWAIGVTLAASQSESMTSRLKSLFIKGCARLTEFQSPRSWAFALLGLQSFREAYPDSQMARALQLMLAERLTSLFKRNAGLRWAWFEDVVTYDNGKLPQALLGCHRQTGRQDFLRIGIASLSFLLQAQTNSDGHFRPIGCNGFWHRGKAPARFDQQPLEAQAMVAACLEAWHATSDRTWLTAARRVHRWFHGANDLGIPIAQEETGGCCDGLTPDGTNFNQGAESTLAFLQSTLDLDRAARAERDAVRENVPASAAPTIRPRPAATRLQEPAAFEYGSATSSHYPAA